MILIGMLGYGDRCPSVQSLIALAMNDDVETLLIFWNQPGINMKEILNELNRS